MPEAQVVGNCPKCSRAIKSDHMLWMCPDCGNTLPQEILRKINLMGLARGPASGEEQQITRSYPAPREALRQRYREAYVVAARSVEMGRAIEGVGIVLGILVGIGGIAVVAQLRVDNPVLMLFALTPGATIGALVYAIGVFVAANGQMLLASLDSAVNGSPFLDTEGKAEVMSLQTQL